MAGARIEMSSSRGRRIDVLHVAPFPLDADRGTPQRARQQLDLAQRSGLVAHAIGMNPPGHGFAGEGCSLPIPRPARAGWCWQKPLFDVELFVRTVRAIRARQPSVIEAHVHEGLAIALAARWITRGEARVVYNAHGTLAAELVAGGLLRPGTAPHRLVVAAERWLEDHADAVLAQSEPKRACFDDRAVDATTCVDVPPQALFDLSLDRGVEDGEIVAVYAGSLAEYQGVDDLLRAAQRTRGVRYVFFGSPSGRYPALAEQLGVVDRVEFVDPAPADQLAVTLGRAHVGLAPRRAGGPDSVPGKIPAYLAAGLPVVATSTAGIDAVVDDTIGICVEPGDVDGLAAAIQRLADDDVARERLGRAARRRALDDYSVEAAIGALRLAYAVPA